MIINVIKKSFFDVINNPAPALIIVLFMIICNLFGAYMLHVTNLVASTGLSVCLLLIIVCFFAGLTKLFREISKNKTKEKPVPFGVFLEGTGENFFSVLWGALVYSFLLLALLILISELAEKMFGSLDFVFKDLETLPKTNEAFANYITNLPTEKSYIIYASQLSIMLAYCLYCFFLIFFYPALIDEQTVNIFLKPFVAIRKSVVFVFKNFWSVLFLSLVMFLISVLLLTAYSFIPLSSIPFMILSYAVFFLLIYFVVFVIMVVFNYYEAKNENNGNNGSDGVGEDESVDCGGEKI